MRFINALLFLLFINATNLFSQSLPKKPTLDDVRAYNQTNLMKVELGFNKEQVIKAMGGMQNIQSYYPKDPYTWAKPKYLVIANPYSRDLKTGKDSATIEILWYYTDLKNADGAINKEELTPIILEKNAVVGVGWGFYTDYAKKQEITVDVR